MLENVAKINRIVLAGGTVDLSKGIDVNYKMPDIINDGYGTRSGTNNHLRMKVS